jgi:ribose transport system ATP-binding protein
VDEEYMLQTYDICKVFSGNVALQDISLGIKKASVHALIGENGAGKSTFVKIISGAYTATSGHFVFEGKKITQITPHEAQELGIGIVHQDLNLIPELSVAENIFLGREITNKIGKIDWSETNKRAKELLRSFDIDFDVRAKISSLSVAEQQMVEIVKVLSMNSNLIILDEPTDVLTGKETEQLFKLIRRLRDEGKTIIYISHRLDELKHICDMVSIFRDGRLIYTGGIGEHSKEEVVQMMVARKLTEQYPYAKSHPTGVALKVENLCQGNFLKDISFEAKKGEILGVYGLVGSGRTEMARCVVGVDRKASGSIEIDGKRVNVKNPTDALRHGLAYITESRKEFGLMLDMSVAFNTSIAVLRRCLNKIRGISRKAEYQCVRRMIAELEIKTESTQKIVRELSGGNQQKVLLARYMLTEPKVLIVDEPTRGIDVGAKVSIYNILNRLKKGGVSIIMISSDLPEVMGISDRVMVMYNGAITGEFNHDELNEDVIGMCAFGKKKG